MSDIVTIGDATLYHGDCLEILPRLDKVDAVVTDPPYGIARFNRAVSGDKGGGKGFGTTRFKGHGAETVGLGWDVTPDVKVINLLLDIGSEHIFWGMNHFALPPTQYFFIWDKQQTVDNFAEAELAYTDIKMPAKIFKYSIHQHNADERNKGHPTQKPIKLMEWCLMFLKTNGPVLDPFMGSGTTGVACANLGRKFIGIEIERKYFDIACERIEAAYAQGRLFT